VRPDVVLHIQQLQVHIGYQDRLPSLSSVHLFLSLLLLLLLLLMMIQNKA
jgi:hypothetical protein